MVGKVTVHVVFGGGDDDDNDDDVDAVDRGLFSTMTAMWAR